FSNRSYAILLGEFANGRLESGAQGARHARPRPSRSRLGGLARAMAVPGGKVTTMEAFNERFAEGIASPGPYLAEVVL
ncbi:MAG TPA: hypothetical protein VEQ62_04930, partial [Stellaceae bacterium]|nr:hypothetical protein [Stellaceae bacterium]